MTIETEPLPSASTDVRGGVIAYLQVEGATEAAAFYEKAFGAKRVAAHPVDDKGRTMHIHLHINGGSLMLSDFYPEHGVPRVQPQAFSLVLQVDDIDTRFQRAADAGCTVTMPVQKMFWGDRYGGLRDPFGVTWGFNEPAR
jgi:uncharacterized glyoxalase superfamily protein PhnB